VSRCHRTPHVREDLLGARRDTRRCGPLLKRRQQHPWIRRTHRRARRRDLPTGFRHVQIGPTRLACTAAHGGLLSRCPGHPKSPPLPDPRGAAGSMGPRTRPQAAVRVRPRREHGAGNGGRSPLATTRGSREHRPRDGAAFRPGPAREASGTAPKTTAQTGDTLSRIFAPLRRRTVRVAGEIVISN
jgi:hypothetical protein